MTEDEHDRGGPIESPDQGRLYSAECAVCEATIHIPYGVTVEEIHSQMPCNCRERLGAVVIVGDYDDLGDHDD